VANVQSEDHPAVLRISVIGTPNSLAADVNADLVLCALNTEMSIPDKNNTVFFHLAMVSLEALPCGLIK
jgi:hypothetical protein